MHPRWRRRVPGLGLATACLLWPVWLLANNAPMPEADLLRGAQMWGAKNRPEIARQLLDKALVLNPDSAQAQAQLAELALRENKVDEARQLLERLQARHPQHRATRDLALLYQVQTQGRERLAAMRLMARAGRKAEAAQIARELFPDGPPLLGSLALEYHQVVGSETGSARQAERQLDALYRDTGDSRYRLAQIEMRLSQSDPPAAVLRELEAISREPDLNQQALQDLWRKAIDRIDPNAGSIPWLKAFLRRFPGDAAMIERLAGAQAQAERAERIARDPANLAARAGRAALDKGDLDAAAAQLQTAIGLRPKDAESLGSLGLIRLRQGRHAEAQELFQLAQQIAPQRKWAGLLATARLWGHLRAAEQALDDKDLARAETLARQAVAQDPDNTDALLTLASVLTLAEQTPPAIELYQRALSLEPANPAAVQGLATLYARQGRRDAALALLAQSAERDPALAGKLAPARAELLRAQAEEWLAAQRISPALRAFEAAVLLTPDDAWLRHALARLYLRLQLPREARTVMDDGVTHRPQAEDMRYARALIRSAVEDDAGALADLDHIAPSQLTDGMRELQQRTWVNLRLAQALRSGGAAQAAALLQAAEARAGQDADLLYAVANAWFRLGQPAQGVAVFDRLLQRQPELPASAALDHAILLNRARLDAVLAPRLTALLSRTDWSAEQEARLLTLYTESQERGIEQQRLAGQAGAARALAAQSLPPTRHAEPVTRIRASARLLLAADAPAQALPLLQDALRQAPNDADLRLDVGNALARLGQSSGAREQADWLARHLDATDVDRRLGLLRLWQRAQGPAQAQTLAQTLLTQFPDHPDVLAHAARLERSQGRYGPAVALFKAALRVELASRSTTAPTDPPSPPSEAADLATAAKPTPPSDDGTAPPVLRMAYALAPRVPLQAGQGVATDAGSDLAEPPLLHASTTLGGPGDMPPLRPGDFTTPALLAAAPTVPLDDGLGKLRQDIEAIEARRQAWVESGLQRLQKNSTDGISSLRGWEQANVVWIPGGYDGPYFVHVDRVSLDAGPLPNGFREAIPFGQVAASDPGAYAPGQAAQAVRGTNLGIGRETDQWRWDLGAVGIGMPVTNVVGGLSHSRYDENGGYHLEASRRPLTGSLLSYAGARDPITGQVWGGVVATGVQARRSVNLGDYSLSGSASYARLTGQNVQSNTRMQLRASLDRDLVQTPDQRVNVGLALSLWRHAHDLSEYSWGHGGYYSPQRYASLALPVDWSGRRGPWAWQLRASASLSRSASDATPYYPTRPDLQAQAEAAPGGRPPQYSAFSSTGHGYSLRAVVEHQFNRHWAVGARLDLDRTAYYAPTNLMLYARYRFDPVLAPLENRPTPVQPYSAF